MSKYADKRGPTAECVFGACDANGTKLVILKGVPEWVCERHAELVKLQST